jgi:multidrug efflux pump subunit AcrB
VTASTREKNKHRQFYACGCTRTDIFRAWCDEINFKLIHLKHQFYRHEENMEDMKKAYMSSLKSIFRLLVVTLCVLVILCVLIVIFLIKA